MPEGSLFFCYYIQQTTFICYQYIKYGVEVIIHLINEQQNKRQNDIVSF